MQKTICVGIAWLGSFSDIYTLQWWCGWVCWFPTVGVSSSVKLCSGTSVFGLNWAVAISCADFFQWASTQWVWTLVAAAAMIQVFNTCRFRSIDGCTEVTAATWAATLLNQVSGEETVGFRVPCSFQQCHIMLYKLCFLFSVLWCIGKESHKLFSEQSP